MANDLLSFDTLIAGLAAFLPQQELYPYPDLFRHACNTLALQMTAVPYPRTLKGLLSLFEQPVRTWWPLALPDAFDPEARLLYEGALSEEAAQYFYTQLLDRAGLSATGSTVLQQLALENYQFKRLLERLQEAPDTDQAQQEYVRLRAFLIEHPHTTTEQLRAAFRTTRILGIEQVGDLYDVDWPADRSCWTCDYCGPLTEYHGQLRGIKPEVCNDHRAGLPYVHQIPWQRGLRRIRVGIHWRICQPGLTELRLFRELEALQQQCPAQLCAVTLWPGIDRYDLQLRFGDGMVWAIDVKDYRSPYNLAPKLIPLYGEGDLRYDESFYVFPLHRVHTHEGYIRAAREAATGLPKQTHTLTEVDFKARVITKIEKLRQGEDPK